MQLPLRRLRTVCFSPPYNNIVDTFIVSYPLSCRVRNCPFHQSLLDTHSKVSSPSYRQPFFMIFKSGLIDARFLRHRYSPDLRTRIQLEVVPRTPLGPLEIPHAKFLSCLAGVDSAPPGAGLARRRAGRRRGSAGWTRHVRQARSGFLRLDVPEDRFDVIAEPGRESVARCAHFRHDGIIRHRGDIVKCCGSEVQASSSSLVLGSISPSCGSREQATRRARANALKTASTLWWLERP